MKHRFFRFSFGTIVVIAACPMLTLWAQTEKAASAPSASLSTPRAANEHPDLSGMWNGAAGGGGGATENNGNITTTVASRRCAPNQKGCGEHTNQTVDGEFTGRMDSNRPLYKPEFWDKVQDLDRNTNTMDPIFKCQPYGVPRVGPPTKIVQ